MDCNGLGFMRLVWLTLFVPLILIFSQFFLNGFLAGVNPDEETSSEKKEKPVNEFEQKLAEDKAKKEKAQPTKVQNASSQFDDLFNN